MKKTIFSIGEAAEQAGMTRETLRHYDRIGLVKPSRVDPYTNYRYYSGEDIVRLNTVHALQQMDLPLAEIKQVLEYDDLEKIIAFLEQAEQKADEKIASLRRGKAKIQRAKADYVEKLQSRRAAAGVFTREFPERVIMLADSVDKITLDDLWSYLRHFYRRLSDEQKDRFDFENLAGVYRSGASARYFAVCTRYEEIEGLIRLPAGTYLCADCTEENWRETLEQLMDTAEARYHGRPAFSLQLVVVSGILQWTYQLQVYAGGSLAGASGRENFCRGT